MSKTEKKEVVVKQQTGTAVADLGYGDYGRAGFEGMSSDDLSIPFINLLQSNSELVENDEAKPGQMYNKVTGEILEGDKGIVFVPCFKQHLFVEWVPVDQGGGLVGVHAPDSEIVKNAVAANQGNRFGGLTTNEGKHDLVETHYVYGLILDEEGNQADGFAVIAFSSSKIRVVRDWFTAMYMMKGQIPLFANRARIKSVKQKNKAGTFFNFKIEPFSNTWKESLIPANNKNLLDEAQNFMKMVDTGKAKADFSTADVADVKEGDGKTPF